MSYYTYIASDYPLPVVERPDRDSILEIDTETGDVFDGDYEDDFALYPAEGLSDVCTEKKYAVYLEWSYYTEDRAKNIRELDEREIKIDMVEGYETVDQYRYVVKG